MDSSFLSRFISSIDSTDLATWAHLPPWELTRQSEGVVRQMLESLDPAQFHVRDDVAIHVSAVIEQGVTLKGPLIINAGVFVGAHAYIRGGCWIDRNCSIGPGCELKSSFVFADSRLAHFNFVGDSLIGRDVNLEAGSIICNHRNERIDKNIYVRIKGNLFNTGAIKFGAVVGDGSRLGANSVVAPGALIDPATIIERASLRDDDAAGGS